MIKEKIRVNITVDKDRLERARAKLHLFGGKLSTLFNAYLSDFVTSIDKELSSEQKSLKNRIEILEAKIKSLEKK